VTVERAARIGEPTERSNRSARLCLCSSHATIALTPPGLRQVLDSVEGARVYAELTAGICALRRAFDFRTGRPDFGRCRIAFPTHLAKLIGIGERRWPKHCGASAQQRFFEIRGLGWSTILLR
jgi:hypothetical protein